MPFLNTTDQRLIAAFLIVASLVVTPWLGRLLIALLLYYGTPGQSWSFYAIGWLVVLSLMASLVILWIATARALFRVMSQR